MNPILFAVLVVAGIGLIVGIVLAVASAVMAVPKDEKAEAILEALPGANCGACGFSGCSGYAKALADGSAKPGLCSPGGEETAKAVAAILGTKAEKSIKRTAVVHCSGSLQHTENKMEYQGISSCAAAVQLGGGPGKCAYGCIGLGDCKAACEYDAITVCNGLAAVNPDKCKACTMCVSACPKKLISILPVKKQAQVLCSSCDKGAQTKAACSTGCIGCMRCVKACEFGAIKVEKFHAVVDPSLCTGCMKCVESCKQGCIVEAFS